MEGYLEHYGVKAMKWGVRRYQNPDGTLTEAGKRRYRRSPEYLGYETVDRARKTGDTVQRKIANSQIRTGKKIERYSQKSDRLSSKRDSAAKKGNAKLESFYKLREKRANKKLNSYKYIDRGKRLMQKQYMDVQLKDTPTYKNSLLEFEKRHGRRGIDKLSSWGQMFTANIQDERHEKKNRRNKDGDHLEHFGIKGMHWGIRRTPEELGYKPTRGGKYGTLYQKAMARSADKLYTEHEKTGNPQQKKMADNIMSSLRKQTRASNKEQSRTNAKYIVQKSLSVISSVASMAYTGVSIAEMATGQAFLGPALRYASLPAIMGLRILSSV